MLSSCKFIEILSITRISQNLINVVFKDVPKDQLFKTVFVGHFPVETIRVTKLEYVELLNSHSSVRLVSLPSQLIDVLIRAISSNN
jgi:hypothetical protein